MTIEDLLFPQIYFVLHFSVEVKASKSSRLLSHQCPEFIISFWTLGKALDYFGKAA